MRIRIKTALVLGLGIISVSSVAFFVTRLYNTYAFSKIERSILKDRLRGAEALYEKDLEELLNDTIAFTEDEYFIEKISAISIPVESGNRFRRQLKRAGVLAVAYADANGEIEQVVYLDEKGTVSEAPSPIMDFLTQDNYLRKHRYKKSSITGVVTLKDPVGTVMVASVPVLPNDPEGLIKGTVIFAKRLEDSRLFGVLQRSGLSVRATPLAKSTSSGTFNGITHGVPLNATAIRELSENALAGYMILSDVYGKSAVKVRIRQNRSGYANVHRIPGKVFLISLVVSVLMFAICMVLLELMIFRRLCSLLRQTNHLKSLTDISSGHIELSGKDELSDISHGIRYILSALKVNRFRWLRNEKRLQALLNSFDSGVFLVDMATGLIKRANANAWTIMQKNHRDIIGKSLFAFMKSSDGKHITVEDLQSSQSNNGTGLFSVETPNGEQLIRVNSRILDAGKAGYLAVFFNPEPLSESVPSSDK